jgi:hypothetical protein
VRHWVPGFCILVFFLLLTNSPLIHPNPAFIYPKRRLNLFSHLVIGLQKAVSSPARFKPFV